MINIEHKIKDKRGLNLYAVVSTWFDQSNSPNEIRELRFKNYSSVCLMNAENKAK